MRRTSTMLAGALLVIGSFALISLAALCVFVWICVGSGPWPPEWPAVPAMALVGAAAGIVGVRLADPERAA